MSIFTIWDLASFGFTAIADIRPWMAAFPRSRPIEKMGPSAKARRDVNPTLRDDLLVRNVLLQPASVGGSNGLAFQADAVFGDYGISPGGGAGIWAVAILTGILDAYAALVLRWNWRGFAGVRQWDSTRTALCRIS